VNDQTDAQLLRAYAEHRSEPAFAELVRRHVDFAYSAALRMVCDPHLTEDVTQSVFLALAKNAAQLTDRPVLSGWLHRTAQNIAAQTVRTDVRRRAREQEAAAMNDLLSAEPEVVWENIAPHLDAALGGLSEPDRDALLLRYFERKSAREMAEILGTSEDAAQKRVSRAIERLRDCFAKRGLTVGASGLAIVISANAVQAAPLGLSASISTSAALSGAAMHQTATIGLTKTLAMTTIQKPLIAATLAVAVGTGIYEARRASHWESEMQTLLQQHAPLVDQVGQLQKQRDGTNGKLAALQLENEQLRRDTVELAKLRGEVARLRADARQLARLQEADTQKENDPTETAMRSWLSRVSLLKQRLEQTPSAKIPEFQFLTEEDWLNVARDKIDTDTDNRKAMSALRKAAESKFGSLVQRALRQYMQANNSQFPTELSRLRPYSESPLDDAVLKRWQIAPANLIPNMRVGSEDWVVTQKAGPVDEDYDSRLVFGPNGSGANSFFKLETATTEK